MTDPMRVTRQEGGAVQLDLLGPDGEVVIYVTMTAAEARATGEALFKAGAEVPPTEGG